MSERMSRAFALLLLSLFLTTLLIQRTHGQSNGWHSFHARAIGPCQALLGPDAQKDATLGLTVALSHQGGPLRVTHVIPDGPAAAAGIGKGDLIWGSGENNSPSLIDSCELLRQERSSLRDATPVRLYHQPGGQESPVAVTLRASTRSEVYRGEAQFRSNYVDEWVDKGRFRLTAALYQGPHGEFSLKLGLQNLQTESLLELNENKIFLLDGNGEQLTLYSYAEWRSSIESLIAEFRALAQGMEPVPNASAPQAPPPTHYRISGTADGTYTLTPLGSETYEVRGQSQMNYTVTPYYTTGEQFGQAVNSIASLIERIRIARNNKKIKELRQRAETDAQALQGVLADGIAAHLDTTQPIAPGGQRVGLVSFLSRDSLNTSTVKAIVVVNDSATKKDHFVTFQFHP